MKRLIATMAVAVLVAAVAAWAAWPSGPPNVLLITIETTRADHCSLYGYERDTTPFLRSMAGTSHVFDYAFSESSWTKPSVASIITGKPVTEHACHRGADALQPRQTTIAERLRAAGYATAGFWVNDVIDRPEYGYGQGCDFWSRPGTGSTADHLAAETAEWIRRQDGPWFVHLHFFDPHSPYRGSCQSCQVMRPVQTGHYPDAKVWRDESPPTPDELENAIRRYDAEILDVDRAIGRLWARFNGNTALIVTSDHGEAFGEHGDYGHGRSLYPTLLRVPLLVPTPGQRRGRRAKQLVRGIDIMPTIAELAGVDVPDAEGVSLLGTIPERSFTTALWLPIASQESEPLRVWRTNVSGPLQAVTLREREETALRAAFDLSEDPLGLRDRSGQSRFGQLLQRAGRAVQWQPMPLREETDEEVLEQLRGLGYL